MRRIVCGLLVAGFSVPAAWSSGKAAWPPPPVESRAPAHAAEAGAHAPSTAAPAPAAHAPAPAAKSARPSPGQKAWAELLEGNRRFVRGTLATRDMARRRAELLAGQHPVAAVLGCADSRVPPELVFDRGLGELFVVRTAGNVADRVALGSLEYAVEHLGVNLLVVLGHEKCGAVAASAEGHRPESPHLAEIVDRIAPGLERLREFVDGPGLLQIGVDVNVHRSARALLDESDVLRRAVAEGRLTVVKAVYRLDGGEVVRLD